MSYKSIIAESELIPTGFVAIGVTEHPRNGETGMLIRNRSTGLYALIVGGAICSVPHKWAADTAANMGKGSDAIQELCIARMEALGLNPNQVAERVGDKISRTHVCDYLGRRASLGSHKLQHLLPVLGLRIMPAA